ncbi:MAG: phospholipase D-like domain-containing protein [Gemmatimonas sp.]
MAADRLPRELRRYRAWSIAHRLVDGVRDREFRALVQRILRHPVHESPSAQLLVDGELAFKAMLAAIDDAQEEVLLETYILRDDNIGASVHRALANAVGRGARVYVLADAVGSIETGEAYWDGLQADGITLRLFHRLRYLPFEALRRDHRKMIVVDRTIALTGGMNIGEEYGSSIRRGGGAWRDTLVRVEGTVAQELAAVFAEGWDRAKGPPLPGLEYVSWSESVPGYEDTMRSLSDRPWSTRTLRARVKQQLVQRLGARRDRRRGRRVRRPAEAAPEDSASTALVLDSRPGRGQREVLAVLASLAGGARKRLWITTPYFAPPSRALALLRAAARRGVDVRLLVPGERTDVALVRHAAHGAYSSLLDAGVRVFEYQLATLHAKTVVVDSHAGVIGSTNLDFRSFWLNAECNVLLFDDGIAQDLERSFAEDCAHSVEITRSSWSMRSMRHALGDWLARQMRWAL